VAGVHLDLNADLGEGFGRWSLGDDEGLLDVVTSANVACGFHAGDPVIMRRVCRQAVERGVVIGAQVGYRDLAGFGRRRIDITPDELSAEVLYQLGALQASAQAAGDRVRYLKPHGALYNTAITDRGQASAIVDAVLAFDPRLPVLTLPHGALVTAATDRGVTVIAEAFADRGYRNDATLQPRDEAGAVLTDPDAIRDRAREVAVRGGVTAADGTFLAQRVQSLCVHGDSPGAVARARAVRRALVEAGVTVHAFA
jgi:UPF0271 protein